MGYRLLGVALLMVCAGCEQSSFSSSGGSQAKHAEQAKSAQQVAAGQPTEAPATSPTTPSPSAETTPSAPKFAQPTKDVTFDDIKFEIEKDGKFERSMLTPKIEALAGQPIRIRGYILPTFQQSGIRNFVLVRDNMECCFGPGAALYDCIVVEMAPGTSVEFTTRPVTVEGTFGLREMLDFDGVVRAIYHLDAVSVR
jgi:hypothetical protein